MRTFFAHWVFFRCDLLQRSGLPLVLFIQQPDVLAGNHNFYVVAVELIRGVIM